jgi:hypothetical protein
MKNIAAPDARVTLMPSMVHGRRVSRTAHHPAPPPNHPNRTLDGRVGGGAGGMVVVGVCGSEMLRRAKCGADPERRRPVTVAFPSCGERHLSGGLFRETPAHDPRRVRAAVKFRSRHAKPPRRASRRRRMPFPPHRFRQADRLHRVIGPSPRPGGSDAGHASALPLKPPPESRIQMRPLQPRGGAAG